MNKIKLPQGVWVVVCDGAKALILENTGDAEFPQLVTRAADTNFAPPTRELGTAPPTRVHQSVGTAHSAAEQTDWHDKAETDFLIELVKRLDAAVAAKTVRRLVIVAPPRALGHMRKHYTDRLRGALEAEIDKDLTAVPVYEIEKRLAGR
jgi:protein required for attachment to host cells